MTDKKQESMNIHPLISVRRSTKSFSKSREVSRDTVTSLLEAARWAPSSNNKQPWRFIVFDESNHEKLEQARYCLSENNRTWAGNAPVLILANAEEVNPQGKTNSMALHDLGLANENILLQAISMGLHCHPMGGFDKAKTREMFAIPHEYRPVVMIAIGYPAEKTDIPEEFYEFDQRERERRVISDIAFSGTWGSSF